MTGKITKNLKMIMGKKFSQKNMKIIQKVKTIIMIIMMKAMLSMTKILIILLKKIREDMKIGIMNMNTMSKRERGLKLITPASLERERNTRKKIINIEIQRELFTLILKNNL